MARKYFENYQDWIDYLYNQYESRWWECIVRNWNLLDEYLFYWEWLKFTLLLEQYVGSNSSKYKVRQFKKLPKKYEKYFFEYED